MADWTRQLIEYGNDRNWAPLAGRRALRRFREATGVDASGFAADRAFRLGYNSLTRATEAERFSCRCWQDVKRLIDRDQAAEDARIRERAAQRLELLAEAEAADQANPCPGRYVVRVKWSEYAVESTLSRALEIADGQRACGEYGVSVLDTATGQSYPVAFVNDAAELLLLWYTYRQEAAAPV